MIELFEVAKELQELCEQQQWKFCFIGGIALQRWGEYDEKIADRVF